MPLATGSVLLGKYQIEQLLGEGGFGYVYRATDQSLGRAVAVKELKPEAGQDAQALQRFLQEARAAAALNHPNIVTIHALETHGGYFIIMEFMAGGGLDNLLRQRPDHRLTPQEAVGVIAAVCDGLAAAHGLGIVHRDIKPSNILFTADGRPKLTDFGIAHVPTVITGQAGLTQTGLALGTVLYMAPEQSRGRRVDGRVDLYALGVVLYEAILGRRYLDFEADNQLRNLDLIATQPPIPPRALDPTLSRTLEQVMLRALAKDPARRYQTAQEIGTALLSLSPRALVTPTRPITPLRPIPGVKLPTPSPVSPRPGVPPQPVSPRAPVSPPVSPRTPTSPPVSPPRPAAAPTVALPPPLPGTEVTAPPAAAPPAEQAPTPLPVPAGVPPAIMPSMGQEAVVVPSLRKLYPLLALAGVVVVMLLLVGLVRGAGLIGPGPAVTPLFTPTMTATKEPMPTVTLALIPAAITRVPTATPTPTLTPVPPTATPTPTHTSIPTATPTPTPSYTPMPTLVPPTPVPPTSPPPTPVPSTPTKTLPPPLPTPTKTLPPVLPTPTK